MKRFAFALGLVAATTFAAPLAAQSRNSGPWYDPSNTGNRGSTDTRNGNGTVYGRNGTVNGNTRADGQWRLAGRDRNGNNVYVRTRYDSNGNLVQEVAHRNILGRYSVFDRQVLNTANNRNNRGVYDRNGRNDNDRNNDGYDDRNSRNSNDRWDQNNGHDNGKHNGQYKDKNKNKNKGRRD